jgi:hypothetical protein
VTMLSMAVFLQIYRVLFQNFLCLLKIHNICILSLKFRCDNDSLPTVKPLKNSCVFTSCSEVTTYIWCLTLLTFYIFPCAKLPGMMMLEYRVFYIHHTPPPPPPTLTDFLYSGLSCCDVTSVLNLLLLSVRDGENVQWNEITDTLVHA